MSSYYNIDNIDNINKNIITEEERHFQFEQK